MSEAAVVYVVVIDHSDAGTSAGPVRSTQKAAVKDIMEILDLEHDAIKETYDADDDLVFSVNTANDNYYHIYRRLVDEG